MYPLLPLLLTGAHGAPAAVVGIVEGSAELAAGVSKCVAGRLLNRIMARKLRIGSGYGLLAFGQLIVAAAGIWPIVLVGRVVDRVGKGVRSASRDSLLARDVAPGNLGRIVLLTVVALVYIPDALLLLRLAGNG